MIRDILPCASTQKRSGISAIADWDSVDPAIRAAFAEIERRSREAVDAAIDGIESAGRLRDGDMQIIINAT